jgi:hypothetical protein
MWTGIKYILVFFFFSLFFFFKRRLHHCKNIKKIYVLLPIQNFTCYALASESGTSIFTNVRIRNAFYVHECHNYKSNTRIRNYSKPQYLPMPKSWIPYFFMQYLPTSRLKVFVVEYSNNTGVSNIIGRPSKAKNKKFLAILR